VGKKSGPPAPDGHDNDAWWFSVATVPKKAQLPRTDAILRPKDNPLNTACNSSAFPGTSTTIANPGLQGILSRA